MNTFTIVSVHKAHTMSSSAAQGRQFITAHIFFYELVCLQYTTRLHHSLVFKFTQTPLKTFIKPFQKGRTMSLCSSFHSKLKVLSKNTKILEKPSLSQLDALQFSFYHPLLFGKVFVNCASPRSKADAMNSRWMMVQEDLRTHITMIIPVDQRRLFFTASLTLVESLHKAKAE